jgi:hypothetical protein
LALSVDGITRHHAHEDYRIVVFSALLYGISMSTYENNMRAEVANLLQHYEVLAYSATSFAKSFSAGICMVVSTVILNADRHDVAGIGLEVELIFFSLLGMAGFISAVMIDGKGGGDVTGQLEQKLLRESERNSIISDFESLYAHNSINNDYYRANHNSIRASDTMSNHTHSTFMGEEGGDDDGDHLSRASSISCVSEDEFLVPDYF